jgi:hypothetical protein
MFGSMRLFGISFASRRSRRVLVVATYIVLAGYLSVFCLPMRRWNQVAAQLFAAVLLGVSYLVFGSVVQNLTFVRREAVQGLGLSRPFVYGAAAPDEFEVALRNAAHYKAFRFVAYSSLGLACLVLGLLDNRSRLAGSLVLVTMLSFVAIVLTLPQAIVLWEQPDFLSN